MEGKGYIFEQNGICSLVQPWLMAQKYFWDFAHPISCAPWNISLTYNHCQSTLCVEYLYCFAWPGSVFNFMVKSRLMKNHYHSAENKVILLRTHCPTILSVHAAIYFVINLFVNPLAFLSWVARLPIWNKAHYYKCPLLHMYAQPVQWCWNAVYIIGLWHWLMYLLPVMFTYLCVARKKYTALVGWAYGLSWWHE